MQPTEDITGGVTEGITRERPLVSIALCTCDGEVHLKEQMDSLLAQDYPNLEIVVVDDASQDSTPQIIQEYADRHPRIELHQNPERLGFVENFQKCLQTCRGELIALCDQDDVWLPHKISTMVSAIGNASLAYSRVRVVDAGGQPLDREHPKRNLLDGHCALSLVLTNFVTGHACLIRKTLLDKALPVPAGHVHDQWLAFCSACSEGGIAVVDEVLSDYRMHGHNQILGSSVRGADRPGPDHFEAFASHGELNELDAGLIRELSELMSRSFPFYHLTLHCFLNANPKFLAAYRNPARVRRKLCMRQARGGSPS